jgi:pimeloyl-ACP methyl ester carboxylesterase
MEYLSRFRARVGVFLVAAVLFSASAVRAGPPLAEVIVTAPNRLNPFVGPGNPLPPLEVLAGADQHLQVRVGPPEATLAVSIFEPHERATPRATVLVIHGIYARGFWMLQTARALNKAGYRAALVDLRGHGRSTGEYLTFGVQEAKDLSQVIDALAQRGLVSGSLGVYGISYGATTAIHLAGLDPRVKAVVAVAPFSQMRDEVPQFGRTMVPGLGGAIPWGVYQEAIDQAGRKAQFDPDAADAVRAIQRTSAQVLLIHGTNDWIVPHRNGARLHEAARDHSQLVSIPCLGHIAVWVDPTGEVASQTRGWFDRWLSEEPAAKGEKGDAPRAEK